jgi:hypothetical protein
MNSSQSKSVSNKLAGAVEVAREWVATAETQWRTAKEQARLAKRRRREVRLIAKRARKEAKRAKEELVQARTALAEAEAKLAKHGVTRIRPSRNSSNARRPVGSTGVKRKSAEKQMRAGTGT